MSAGLGPKGRGRELFPQNGSAPEMNGLADGGHSTRRMVQRQGDVNDILSLHLDGVVDRTREDGEAGHRKSNVTTV